MSFIDIIFFPFIFLVIILYFLVPLKYRWIVLLLTSVSYFCTWGVNSLPFIIGAASISWIIAIVIEKWNCQCNDKIKENENIDQKQINILQTKTKKRCKYLLWLGVACVLSVLIWTKMDSLISILGVSYYTMSLIGYMADVYWKKDNAEHNFFKLLLFAIYFPKILQGPISKHKNIKSQLYNGNQFDYKKFCYGLQRMLWGYFKKLVVADRLLIFVNSAFTDYQTYQGSILLIATIFSALQMYFDFSGCMDIALGISETLGIKLEENFRRPFFAKTVPEFWTRWHISLSTWFKDYIYMPIVISPKMIKLSGKIKSVMGKNAAKHFMSIVPTITVWMITGLWHGTGENYIAWGIFWAVLFVSSTIFGSNIRKLNKLLHIDSDAKWFQTFRQLRTFALFVICRLIVAPGTLDASFDILQKIILNFGIWQLFDGTLFELGLDAPNLNVLIVALVLLFVISIKQENGIKIRDEIAKFPLVLRWSVFIIGILSVLIFGVYGPGYEVTNFVYMYF